MLKTLREKLTLIDSRVKLKKKSNIWQKKTQNQKKKD
jgi:hypothetical protein